MKKNKFSRYLMLILKELGLLGLTLIIFNAFCYIFRFVYMGRLLNEATSGQYLLFTIAAFLIWRAFVLFPKRGNAEETSRKRTVFYILLAIVLAMVAGAFWFLYLAFENVHYN
ncbi:MULTISPECIES: hypothetical protein [Chitinophagaceae]